MEREHGMNKDITKSMQDALARHMDVFPTQVGVNRCCTENRCYWRLSEMWKQATPQLVYGWLVAVRTGRTTVQLASIHRIKDTA